MALSPEAAAAKLRALEEALRLRQADIKKYTEYYNGEHRLKYASEEFRGWFEKQYEGFTDNWCAPVVDATVERLKFSGIRPYGEKDVDSDLQRVWEENSGEVESRLAFATEAITGRSFALVWGDNEYGPTISFEHPSQCIVAYVPGSRRLREAAAKFWQDERYVYGNLYMPDGIYKFVRLNTQAAHDHDYAARERLNRQLWVPEGVGGWEVREVSSGTAEDGTTAHEPWPVPNPMGKVPMVELQNRPQLQGEPLNEISGVAAMQDAINALWSFLFSSADFAALPQRIIMGAQLPKLPVLDKDGKKVGEKPIDLPEANVKRILNLEGPDAKIGQWDAANLDVFTGVIEKAVGHVANQTRTPIYYFASSIENISGDTLQALDAGLCAKVGDRQLYNNDPLKDIFELICLALGDEPKSKAIKGGTVSWADHEMRSDAQKMDRLTKMQSLGLPDRYIFEQFTGGDADEVERILEMRIWEAENDPMSAAFQRKKGMEEQAANQSRLEAQAQGAQSGKPTGGGDNAETPDKRAARKTTPTSGA